MNALERFLRYAVVHTASDRLNHQVTPSTECQHILSEMLEHEMKELGMEPWLLLDMRLGEGSGCPLAFQVLDAACAIINDMATFEQAGINDDYLEEIREGDKFSVGGSK